jgi:hypothetical protein
LNLSGQRCRERLEKEDFKDRSNWLGVILLNAIRRP